MEGVTNIGGGADQFNRYKMPTLIAKVEGKGNGIKTRIVNLTQIGRSLHRRPSYICKFFGCELGAQTKDDDINNVYIVNGAHNAKDLSEILQKFISMFVLCPSCNLPETDLKVKKNGDIIQKCNACGSAARCDATHKLCTYIKNNPPSGKGGKSGKERRKKKSKKPSLKERNETEKEASSKNPATQSNGVDLVKEESTVGDELGPDQTMLMLPGDDMGDLDNMIGDMADFAAQDISQGDEDVEWSVDTSKEAQEARKKEIGDAAKILDRVTITDEKEGKVRKLRAYMDDGKSPSKVFSKAKRIFGTDMIVAGIMDAVILDEPVSTIPKVVKERAVAYLKEAEDLGEKLGKWIDERCEFDENVTRVTAHILKTFFDGDAISEDEILAWYNSDGNEGARESSKPFIEWLQESDEDDDDDGKGEDKEEEDA